MLDNQILLAFEAYLFDLDNTIYDENRYLLEIYKQIALRIADNTSIDHVSILEDIKLIYYKTGRDRLFDSLILKYKLRENILEEFLTTQRTHHLDEKIEIFPTIEKLLLNLKELNKTILIVTNGNPIQQRNKIDHIDWQGLKSYLKFVLADEIEKKPSLLLFQYIKRKYNIVESKTIMIGDSEVDMQFAKNSQIKFLNISDII